jgi:uncharacterized membrane protein
MFFSRYAARTTTVCFVLLIALGLAWELWLAPLRPGGSWLVLKVLPLLVALPGIHRARSASLKLWSMMILAYVCEGLVRAVSDQGVSAQLAMLETALSALAFGAILLSVKRLLQQRSAAAAAGGLPMAAQPMTPDLPR